LAAKYTSLAFVQYMGDRQSVMRLPPRIAPSVAHFIAPRRADAAPLSCEQARGPLPELDVEKRRGSSGVSVESAGGDPRLPEHLRRFIFRV